MESGFKMYTSEMVEVSPGATVLCGIVHVLVVYDELCFVNAKAGLGLLFDVYEHFNQDGVINSLTIVNKTEFANYYPTQPTSWIFASFGNCQYSG